jgi:hypothetical protein
MGTRVIRLQAALIRTTRCGADWTRSEWKLLALWERLGEGEGTLQAPLVVAGMSTESEIEVCTSPSPNLSQKEGGPTWPFLTL